MSIHPSRATLGSCFALLLASLMPLPSFAQIGNPAGMSPGIAESEPGTPAAGQLNTTDRLFVKLVGMGNAGEIELGKLADARAGHAGVKAFGRMVVQDHTSTANKLAGLAKQAGVAMPNEPDPEQKATRTRLEGLRGAAFDAAYLQSQLVDHQKTAQLLQWEIGAGQEASLQRLAVDALPIVLEHLQQVQALIAETSGTSLQGLAAVRGTR